uniref:RRM domain-containing protein n=1 Tax=Steinernema glaseri TaxID=37863 RepID=A0A1I7ZU04_9BILA
MDSGKFAATPLTDFSSVLLPHFALDPVSTLALTPFGLYQCDLTTMFNRQSMTGYGMDGYPGPQGPHHMPPHPMAPPMRREISYDTSSKDPQMLRSRIFIGNINTSLVTRDDIIKLCSAYGTLLGVTVFKGYAFVQFSNMNEADFAVSILNGYNWNNSCLDVKLALTGMKTNQSHATAGAKRPIAGPNTNGAPGGGNAPAVPRDNDPSGPKMKKSRVDDSHEKNKKEAKESLESGQGIGNLYNHGMPDVLICGGCRFVTSSFSEFRDHRASECTLVKPKIAPKEENKNDKSE